MRHEYTKKPNAVHMACIHCNCGPLGKQSKKPCNGRSKSTTVDAFFTDELCVVKTLPPGDAEGAAQRDFPWFEKLNQYRGRAL